MKNFPIFLSVVLVVRNQGSSLERMLSKLADYLGSLVSDYEIIIVDNASDDNSVSILKGLTEESGLPNLQVFALTNHVVLDIATWVGLENALGDYIAVIDPLVDDIYFLPEMLDKVADGADAIFAHNLLQPRQSISYNLCNGIFNWLYKRFNGINLTKEAPQYRVLSRKVVNFLLQHPQPAITYRHLPVTGGFFRINLVYSTPQPPAPSKRLADSIDRGIRLLVSTTYAPMRIVTALSLFGAFANLAYSVYVVIIGFYKVDVTPGWISLSLQQSGMFFLISLLLLVLGEYILHMASLSNEAPLYHIGQEYNSTLITRLKKLNIEEAS